MIYEHNLISLILIKFSKNLGTFNLNTKISIGTNSVKNLIPTNKDKKYLLQIK